MTNKYSFAEITAVLQAMSGGLRVSKNCYNFYNRSGIIQRENNTIKVRADVFKAALANGSYQAKEMVKTARLVLKNRNVAVSTYSTLCEAPDPTTFFNPSFGEPEIEEQETNQLVAV